MKFVAVSTNTKDVSPFLPAEAQRIDELRAAGMITGGWVKADFSGFSGTRRPLRAADDRADRAGTHAA